MTSPNCHRPAVASPLMTSSDTRPGGLRLASLRFGLGACLMLLSACATDVGDESIDEPELGSAEQAVFYDWGKYTIYSQFWPGRCLDTPLGYWGEWYSGARIQQWKCHQGLNQTFYYGGNDDGTVSFKAFGNKNLCFDVAGASKANGAPVQLYQCNGTGAQKFWVETSSQDGGVYFINQNSGKCLDLDVSGSYRDPYNAPNGSKLQQWDCAWTRNQRFFMQKIWTE